jgi:hypothetical protein
VLCNAREVNHEVTVKHQKEKAFMLNFSYIYLTKRSEKANYKRQSNFPCLFFCDLKYISEHIFYM